MNRSSFKVLTVGLLLCLSFLIPESAFSGKVSTIDELAAMYDIQLCADCHEENHAEWKTSTMGNSVIDPRVLRGFRTFIRLAIDEESTLTRKDLSICLNCHVPQIKDATPELVAEIADLVIVAVEDDNESKREAAKKELSRLNLNCLGCHNLKATGFDEKPREKTIYVPRPIDPSAHKDAGFDTVTTSYLSTSDFCAQCHHCPPSVPWEQCPTLYTSYIEDFVNKGHTETCQDCHMPGDEHRSHRFLSPRDTDFLKTTVTIAITARATRFLDNYSGQKLPAVVVNVELKNHAGHTIPHG